MTKKEIERLRIEIAKEMLHITSNWRITNGSVECMMPMESAVKTAFKYADEFIKQLKWRYDGYENS